MKECRLRIADAGDLKPTVHIKEAAARHSFELPNQDIPSSVITDKQIMPPTKFLVDMLTLL